MLCDSTHKIIFNFQQIIDLDLIVMISSNSPALGYFEVRY